MSRTEGMYLILGTTPEINLHTVNVLFEHAGWVVSTEDSKACYQNCEAHTTEGERFLLLHSHPEEAIAHTIANGAAPEQARDVWLAAAKAMVNFYKRHRKQAVMVFIPNLLADPKAQLTTIGAQLGLPDLDLPTTTHQVEQAPLLERLMASQLLQQTPGITALLAQIEACTLPLTGHSYSAPALDFDAANRQLGTLRVKLAESGQLAMRLQQEASQHLVAKKKAETAYKAESNQTLAKLRSADDANRKLEEKLVGQQQQHAAELALQLEIQEGLRSQLAEVTQQHAAELALQMELQEGLRSQLAEVTQQHAAELALQMEIQEGLRSQLAEVTLQSQQNQKESSLLFEHLHLVQEELEAKFISHNQLQEQVVKIEAQRQTDQQAKQKAEKKLRQTEQKRIEIEAEYKEDLNQSLATLRRTENANRKLEEELAGQQQKHAAKLARLNEQQAQLQSQLAGVTLQSQQSQEQLVQIEALRQADQEAKQNAEKTLQQTEQKRREVEANYKEDLNQTLITLRSVEKSKRKLECQFIARQKLDRELAEYREQQDYALEAANQQIKHVQTELNTFKSSIAFKATAPVRVLKTRFRGNPAKRALKKQAELVRLSGLFNEGWYLTTYPDVAENGINPILHYLNFGAEERRNPSPEFDTDWYLTSHSDVAEAGMNPLIHYIKFGKQEGRSTCCLDHSSLPTLRAA